MADLGLRYPPTNETTIAEYNKVSLKGGKNYYNLESPLRVKLPEYFNLPAFVDPPLPLDGKEFQPVIKEDIVFKKRMKDLSLLA